MTIKTIDTENITLEMKCAAIDAVKLGKSTASMLLDVLAKAPEIALQRSALTDQEILEAWPIRGQTMPHAFDLLWFARFLERKIRAPDMQP